MKVGFKVAVFFLAQIILEVIIMSLIAKMGIPYMDFDSKGEGVTELVMGIGYYYTFSKCIVVVIPYIILMLLGHRMLKASFVILNIIISVVLTSIFWLIFDNPLSELLNPLLGSLFAALFILLIVKLENFTNAK